MRYLLALSLLYSQIALADSQCTTQDYTKAIPAPNFTCPSPQEEALVPDLEVGPKASVPLLTGKAAPWDGILMDKDRVIQLGLRVTALRRLRWMDTLKAQDLLVAEKRLVEDSQKANLQLATSQRDNYKQQLAQTQEDLAKERKWYRSWTFGLIVGIVTTSAAAIAIGYVSRK